MALIDRQVVKKAAPGPLQASPNIEADLAAAGLSEQIGQTIGAVADTYTKALNQDELSQYQVNAQKKVQELKAIAEEAKLKAYNAGGNNVLTGGGQAPEDGPSNTIKGTMALYDALEEELASDIDNLTFAGGKRDAELWTQEYVNGLRSEAELSLLNDSVAQMESRSLVRQQELMNLGLWEEALDENDRTFDSGITSSQNHEDRRRFILRGKTLSESGIKVDEAYTDLTKGMNATQIQANQSDILDKAMTAAGDMVNPYLSDEDRANFKTQKQNELIHKMDQQYEEFEFRSDEKRETFSSKVYQLMDENIYDMTSMKDELERTRGDYTTAHYRDLRRLMEQAERSIPAKEPKVPVIHLDMLTNPNVPDTARRDMWLNTSRQAGYPQEIVDAGLEQIKAYATTQGVDDNRANTISYWSKRSKDEKLSLEERQYAAGMLGSLNDAYVRAYQDGIEMNKTSALRIETGLQMTLDETGFLDAQGKIGGSFDSPTPLPGGMYIPDADISRKYGKARNELQTSGLLMAQAGNPVVEVTKDRMVTEEMNLIIREYGIPKADIAFMEYDEFTGTPIYAATVDGENRVLQLKANPQNMLELWDSTTGVMVKSDMETLVKQAIDQAKENFVIEQQGYLGIEQTAPPSEYTEDQRIEDQAWIMDNLEYLDAGSVEKYSDGMHPDRQIEFQEGVEHAVTQFIREQALSTKRVEFNTTIKARLVARGIPVQKAGEIASQIVADDKKAKEMRKANG